jgi:hypothetical protein
LRKREERKNKQKKTNRKKQTEKNKQKKQTGKKKNVPWANSEVSFFYMSSAHGAGVMFGP